MGLNLDRIAAIKANLAKEKSSAIPAVQETRVTQVANIQISISETKSTVQSGLAGLAALATIKEKTPATSANKPESAGTIKFAEVQNNITQLDAAIKASHPQMPKLLFDIWDTLQKYPENVTLLTEEEIEVIVSGIEIQTSTDLAAITIKAATTGAGKGKKAVVSNLALGF